jgi:NADP-dependent 3-hydroxy acid dehydrogenase YdfG
MSVEATANGRKCIFATGAASGIGRATVRLFASKGWFIGAFDVNSDGLAALRAELGEANCLARRLDVTDKADFDRAVQEFGHATEGRMDLLFNNAGIGRAGFFEDVPFEETMRVVDINFKGVLNGIHAALPLLKATKNSLCFSTSSSSATHGIPSIAVYSATKFAVKGLTEALSIEFERHGIRVADTLPGLIDTGILDSTTDYTHGRRDGREVRESAPKKGMLRLMPPEAVAQAVWEAYTVGGKLHYYVPPEIGRIDKLKVFAPMFVRGQIAKKIAQMVRKSKG